jgi:uncharacterized protein (TIGR02391 family)
MRPPGSRKVTLVKGFGTGTETRQEIAGNIQPKKGFFDVTAPVMVGDVVEDKDPRTSGGVLRYSVADVEIYQGHPRLNHIEVSWGQPPRPPAAKPKVLTIGGLHPRVGEVAGSLYSDGHLAQAAFEAMKAVEVRVREMSGVDEIGQKLMGRVFGGASPMFRLTRRRDKFGQDEHEGRTLMFMGAMQGIRNLGAHELVRLDEAVTLEHLAVASRLMHWLDEVEATGSADSNANPDRR